MRTASWTALLAGAVSHDINNFVQGVSSARSLARSPADAGEMAATIEGDLDQMRKLGLRLRALASAAESTASASLAGACEDALAEVEHRPGQLLRAEPIPAALRVAGTPTALRTVVASLLEHALAASPSTATVRLAVQAPSNGDVIVEIAAPDAVTLGAVGKQRLDVALAITLPELGGDISLVLAGAIVDGLGGSVEIASDAKTGLVLAVHLAAARSG